MAEDKTKGQNGTGAVAMAEAEKPKTEPQLMQEMQAAVKSGDYKAVAKVAQELVKFQKAKEQTELEAKQKVLAEKTETVKSTIDKAVQKLIDAKFLDQADGIWYTHDFGEKLTTCRLLKSQPKAKTGGGGGGGVGKKFAIGTDELLAKFGNDQLKDGMTFQQVWDKSTEKNSRYGVREALLKKGGYIS